MRVPGHNFHMLLFFSNKTTAQYINTLQTFGFNCGIILKVADLLTVKVCVRMNYFEYSIRMWKSQFARLFREIFFYHDSICCFTD